jgi:hypothetical protein
VRRGVVGRAPTRWVPTCFCFSSGGYIPWFCPGFSAC